MRVVLTLCSVFFLAACAGAGDTSTASPGATTGLITTPVTTTTTGNPQGSTDELVCTSLAKTGQAFYEKTYSPVMHKTELRVDPISLAAQLGALTTTGAPSGSIDGTSAVLNASPTVREKLTIMVRDADRIAQRYADAATGAVIGSDITPIVNSFTDALIACSKAGYQPRWFDPKSLVSR